MRYYEKLAVTSKTSEKITPAVFPSCFHLKKKMRYVVTVVTRKRKI